MGMDLEVARKILIFRDSALTDMREFSRDAGF